MFLGFTSGDNIRIGLEQACQIHIHEDDNNVYLCKLDDIQSAAAFVDAMCSHHNVTSGIVTHSVDNDAALTNCFGPIKPSTKIPCFQLIQQIQAEIALSLVKWIRKKVEGHQKI